MVLICASVFPTHPQHPSLQKGILWDVVGFEAAGGNMIHVECKYGSSVLPASFSEPC